MIFGIMVVLTGTHGCAMTQAVSRPPITAEAQVSPRGICGQSGTGTRFSSEFFSFLPSMLSHCDSPHSYHLGDEQ